VTVGKPEVLINGESRPLDVPPIIYQGNVLVPVRVISEGMGAYVQWVPDQRVVVVRYLPATPPPPPATAAPPPPPTPTPAPVATPYHDLFIAGDYIISPKVYNEFSPGNTGTSSWAARGAYEFSALNIPWMVEGNFEQYGYPHNCGSAPNATSNIDPSCFVTGIGGGYSTFVPAFRARDTNIDARFGIRVFNPRVYVGVGYLWRSTNYGYPNMSSFGFGIEKLPDLNEALSFFGSFWYYPSVQGNFSNARFSSISLAYNMYRYQIGADYVIGNSPIFIEVGWMGNDLTGRSNAPASVTANGPFAGLGVKF
jgi:hypothetical protein